MSSRKVPVFVVRF